MTNTITTDDKIACLRREIAMRKRVYPGWVAKSGMSQEKADREIAVMQAIHDDICPPPLTENENASTPRGLL